MTEQQYIDAFLNSKSSYIQIVNFSIAGISIMLAGLISSKIDNGKAMPIYSAMSLLTALLLILHLNAYLEMQIYITKISDPKIVEFFINTILCSAAGFFILLVGIILFINQALKK